MSDKKKNPFQGIVTYFKEVRAELKKVAWPTLKQIKNNTTIVIICLAFVGAIIWVLDLGFKITLDEVVNMAGQTTTTQQTTAPQSGQAATGADAQGGNQLTQEQMDALQKQMQQQQQNAGEGASSETAPQQSNGQ